MNSKRKEFKLTNSQWEKHLALNQSFHQSIRTQLLEANVIWFDDELGCYRLNIETVIDILSRENVWPTTHTFHTPFRKGDSDELVHCACALGAMSVALDMARKPGYRFNMHSYSGLSTAAFPFAYETGVTTGFDRGYDHTESDKDWERLELHTEEARTLYNTGVKDGYNVREGVKNNPHFLNLESDPETLSLSLKELLAQHGLTDLTYVNRFL